MNMITAAAYALRTCSILWRCVGNSLSKPSPTADVEFSVMKAQSLQSLCIFAAAVLFITAYSMAFGTGSGYPGFQAITISAGGFAAAGALSLVAAAIIGSRDRSGS